MGEETTGAYAGRYRIKERIGRGGMAEVFLALATGAAGFERPVVIKSLLPEIAQDPQLAAAFLDEARLLAKLAHPHIAQVLDLGEGPDGTYIVMEYVAGRDLRTVMEKMRRPMNPALAAMIVRDVAEALDHGWNLPGDGGVPLKLIHRDVSLSNVMLSMAGVVKLVDFGLAKALTDYGREATAAGLVKGKWSYLAPEVLKGAPADHRSDIFSTGVVLFELATGRKLYRVSNDVLEVLSEREKTPPTPSTVVGGIPRELDAIVLKALARDPAKRYATAEELAAALDEVVHTRRGRPGQLADLMTNLFEPKRLKTTQEMEPVDDTAPGNEPNSAVFDVSTDPATQVDRKPLLASLAHEPSTLRPSKPSASSSLPGIAPQASSPSVPAPAPAPAPAPGFSPPPKPLHPTHPLETKFTTPPTLVSSRSHDTTPPVGVGAIGSSPWLVAATIGGLLLLAIAALILVFK